MHGIFSLSPIHFFSLVRQLVGSSESSFSAVSLSMKMHTQQFDICFTTIGMQIEIDSNCRITSDFKGTHKTTNKFSHLIFIWLILLQNPKPLLVLDPVRCGKKGHAFAKIYGPHARIEIEPKMMEENLFFLLSPHN